MSREEALRAQWLGRLEYGHAWTLQHLRRESVLDGRAPEVLWLLEHEPVITTGRRSVDDLVTTHHAGRERIGGVPVFRTERGGLATYHGPGQLVGYAIVDLAARGVRVRDMIGALEQGIIDWLCGLGVEAGRREGYPGVWVGRDKICAVGIHVRRGVSMHGFALNLVTDLEAFSSITPCGITDGGVTRLVDVSGVTVLPRDAAQDVGLAVIRAIDSVRGGG